MVMLPFGTVGEVEPRALGQNHGDDRLRATLTVLAQSGALNNLI